MGLASEEEVSILQCVRLNNPEVEQAIQEAQLILEDLATSQATVPDIHLKQSIWDKIQTAEVSSPIETIPENPKESPAKAPFKSKTTANSWPKHYAVAASIVLTLSTLGNIYLYQRSDTMRNSLDEIATNQQETRQKLAESEQRWALLQRPSVKSIALNGVESHPSLKAVVLWDSEQAAVYLSATTLPKAPAGKQYQLWAIVNGIPVDAGILPLHGEETLVRMRDIPKAQAFAITLEQEGGNPTPTLSEMYVVGNT